MRRRGSPFIGLAESARVAAGNRLEPSGGLSFVKIATDPEKKFHIGDPKNSPKSIPNRVLVSGWNAP
jgi:hypothetical protein